MPPTVQATSPPGAAPPRVWGFMYALGRDGPPAQVIVSGRRYRLERIVKHDFWAATSFYLEEATGERAVIKLGRSQPLLGLPMRWAGRFLTHRECRFYQRLGGVPMPLIGLPECELAEIERNKTTNGCTPVEYAGSDGNTYHLFIGDDGPTWLITRYPKVQR